jgi:hypothetical protein
VWLATAAFGLLMALWTVAVPAFRAPDEAAHLDLILHLAEGNGYPTFDGRYVGRAVGLSTDRHLIDLSRPWPRFDAVDAPPRADRPDVDDLGGTAPDPDARRSDDRRAGYPYVYNQMPQHPPLPYVGHAAVLRVERALLPGTDRPSLDRELALLRLVDVALVAPLPLLAWATSTRMGGSDRAGTVAALLPAGVPQLTHVGAAVTNDALLILLGGVLAALLADVARGRRTTRADLAVGVTLGLALLTKAFAVVYLPWVAAAYVVAAVSAPRATGGGGWPGARASLAGGALAGTVGVVTGGWWWALNWLREGEPAPTSETLTRTAAQAPAGFEPDRVGFVLDFPARLLSRTWMWVGHGNPKVELPGAVVALLAAVALGATAVAWCAARRGLAVAGTGASGPGARRVDVALAWVATLLVTAFVFRRSLGLYETNAKVAFLQGRYLFGAVVGPMAVVALGLVRALGRVTVPAVLATVTALQATALTLVVRASWSGPGTFGPMRGALAWSAWPTAAVGTVALALAATLTLLAVEATRHR